MFSHTFESKRIKELLLKYPWKSKGNYVKGKIKSEGK